MMNSHSAFTTRHSLLTTPRALRARGTALIETAIVLPLYMLLLFGLIYFGYATLSKQRQTVAAAAAAWLPAEQQAEDLLEEFWRLAGNTREDIEIEANEEVRLDDPYYGNEVPTQADAGAHTWSDGGDGTFDRERVALALWTMALGEMYSRIVWTPQGFEERVHRSFDHYGHYLNVDGAYKTGWIEAAPGQASTPDVGGYEFQIVGALDGFGAGHWMERRQIEINVEYRPSFFRQVIRDPADEPTDFNTYVSGDYSEPAEEPKVAMTFDLTGRGEAVRYAVGDGAAPEEIADRAAGLFAIELDPADSMNGVIEGLPGFNDWRAL